MSTQEKIQSWIERTDSLAEFIELAEKNDVPEHTQAEQLRQHAWETDVPLKRVLRILQRERKRVKSYDGISFSESTRAPRYMDLADLELVSGHEFEHVLAEVLERIEGRATVTEGSGDQGIDVVWFKDNETVGIQAKAYNLDNPVGNSAVQEAYTGSAVREQFEIDTSAVVTTSRYTEGAKEAADGSDVCLYGRSDLDQWLSEAELDSEAMGDILDAV